MRPIIGITCPWSEETWGNTVECGGFDYAGRAYSAAIYRAGGLPVLLPVFQSDNLLADAKEVLNTVDGLYFTGGGNRKSTNLDLPTLFNQQPRRSQWEATLLKLAYEKDIPTLGVCRGYQMMTVVFGGEMDTVRFPEHKQSVPSNIGIHDITISPGSLLEQYVGSDPWRVNSIHVERICDVPSGFIFSACCADGTIEAIEAPEKRFFLGTQFHPELMPDDSRSQSLFKAFMKAVKKE